MIRFSPKTVLPALALALGASGLLGSTSFAGGFEERVLAAHNLERARMGVGPLQWNPRLADNAQRWADYLAATGRLDRKSVV